MPQLNFDEIVPKLDKILDRGLSKGLGEAGGQICIEAAICEALGLPYGDDPECVNPVVRKFKIQLNDKNWSSPQARATGLRNLGIAQLGSKDTIDGASFIGILSTKIIKVLIPTLFREIFKDNASCLQAANDCVDNPTEEEALKASDAANVAYGAKAASAAIAAKADAIAYAANVATDTAAYATKAAKADPIAYAAATYANVAYAARFAYNAAHAARFAYDAAAATYATAAATYANVAYAANGAANPDKYLIIVANLALEALIELKSPGALWLIS